MTVENAKTMLQQISNLSYDEKVAHQIEDDLYYQFVENIAKGKYASVEEIQEIAKVVVQSANIEFKRYCA